MPLARDPCADGLAGFATRFRSGEVTAEQATADYLARISVLDRRLGAYQHVAAEQALAAARAIDDRYASGVDLGPLMGVPVCVKDLFAVQGMPTTAGSLVPVTDVIGAEGPFVRRLKAAGCVVLGKTKNVEFGLGATGVSAPLGTPWNPWDQRVHRLPGGSSSGAAVAVAAGLCAFAVGGDTGGSIRIPAALCGVFGLKTTFGRWPGDGGFPLAPHLDTVGLLTKSARDAAIVFACLAGSPPIEPAPPAQLAGGVLDDHFFDDLSPEVARRCDDALGLLRGAGARLTAIDLPEAAERDDYFPRVLPACLIATLGPDRFQEQRHLMDPVVAARAGTGLEVPTSELHRLEARRRDSIARVRERFADWDAWISPTTAVPAPRVGELDEEAQASALAFSITRNTQPVNYLALCAASVPIPAGAGELPVGLQLICPGGADDALLALALAVEQCLGAPAPPDLASAA